MKKIEQKEQKKQKQFTAAKLLPWASLIIDVMYVILCLLKKTNKGVKAKCEQHTCRVAPYVDIKRQPKKTFYSRGC